MRVRNITLLNIEERQTGEYGEVYANMIGQQTDNHDFRSLCSLMKEYREKDRWESGYLSEMWKGKSWRFTILWRMRNEACRWEKRGKKLSQLGNCVHNWYNYLSKIRNFLCSGRNHTWLESLEKGRKAWNSCNLSRSAGTSCKSDSIIVLFPLKTERAPFSKRRFRQWMYDSNDSSQGMGTLSF